MRRAYKIAVVAFVVSLPLLMAPTGGLPSRPRFQTVTAVQTATGTIGTPAVTVSAATPVYLLNETDGAANNRAWYLAAGSEALVMGVRDDAASAAADFLTVQRTGTTVDSVNLQATAVQINGTAIATGISGSFTCTLTGFTANPSTTCNYRITNNVVTLTATALLEATSNATSMTMTGLPAAITPAAVKAWVPSIVEDNATLTPGFVNVNTANTLTFAKCNATPSCLSTNFTASGTKGLGSGWSITYPL